MVHIFLSRSAPSTITVLDPNGGEMLLSGSKYTIKWQSSGLGGSNVKLEYSTNNGAGYLTIDANLPDSGSYSLAAAAGGGFKSMPD